MKPRRAAGPGKVAATEEANERTTPAEACAALARHEHSQHTTPSGPVKRSFDPGNCRLTRDRQNDLFGGNPSWYNPLCAEGTAASSASLQILRFESHAGDLPRMSLGLRLIRLLRSGGSCSVATVRWQDRCHLNITCRPSFGELGISASTAGRIHGEGQKHLCEASARNTEATEGRGKTRASPKTQRGTHPCGRFASRRPR